MDEESAGGGSVRASIVFASVAGVFVAVALAVVIAQIFTAARTPILWTLAGVVMTVLFLPAVEALSRWMPRVLAAAAVLVLLAGAYILIGYRFTDDVATGVALLQEELPNAATELEEGSGLLRDVGLADRVRDFVDQLPDASVQVTTAAATAATFLVCGTLTLFLLLYGPRMLEAGFNQVRDEDRRRELRRLTAVALGRSQRYAAGTLIGMLGFGLASYLIARLIDLPAPTPLAVVVGLLSALPYFGVVLGALPILLLSAGLNSAAQAGVLAVVFVALQVVQVQVWKRWLQPRSLYVGPAIIALVGLVSYDLYGLGGLLFGTFIGIFLVALGDAAANTRFRSGDPTPVTDQGEVAG